MQRLRLGDQTGPACRRQRVERGGLVRGRAAAHEQRDVDVPAGHRGRVEEPDAVGGQPRQPAPDGLDYAGRQVAGWLAGALRLQQAGQLPDEQRVAAAAFPDPGRSGTAVAARRRSLRSSRRPRSSSGRAAGRAALRRPAAAAAVTSRRPGRRRRAEPGWSQTPGSRTTAASATARRPSADRRAPRRPGRRGCRRVRRACGPRRRRAGSVRRPRRARRRVRRAGRIRPASPPPPAPPPADPLPAAPASTASTAAHRRPPSRTRAALDSPVWPVRSARPAPRTSRCRPHR